MKKINKYIFCLIVSIMAIFIVNNKKVEGAEFWDNVEVVLNADSNGKPTKTFEKEEKVDNGDGTTSTKSITMQYTSSRDIKVSVYFVENITTTINEFTVCEIIPENTENNTQELKYCSSFEIRDDNVVQITTDEGEQVEKFVVNSVFQLRGSNDGEKKLTIGFNSITGSTYSETGKIIILDTTEPVITINGGEYVYLVAGEKFVDLGATCEDDSDIIESICKVETDGTVIDSNKPGTQYIMYTAIDFLGNEANVTRKVIVEAPKDEDGISLYWIIAGIIVLVVGAALVYIVVKNKEKQRNQSVL